MDGDLGTMLESVLSDPQQMEKIAQMAKSLMGDAAAAPEEQASSDVRESPETKKAPGLDLGMFSGIGKMLSGKEEKSRSTALLMAMRPYMRPEKQEKLDRAMNITRMVHIAGVVMKEYGGGFRGI